ncbi:hypothetical protein [Kamptonema formosum]|uniref:hypothetical protein n=1 Tax=Kamptonema formosum TaxID=331992 RepID=UPI00034807D7|nr:hypothetical protein [Oscillatoria sp. PCC 10802]
MNLYARWFSRVVWAGILANFLLFVIPCCFFPEKLLSFLHMRIPDPIIWVRLAGMLLFIISVFYIPAAIDPYRYRATAWMSVLPSRALGAGFFLGAVFVFGQDKGFLTAGFTDLFFGVVQAILLAQAMRPENSVKPLAEVS